MSTILDKTKSEGSPAQNSPASTRRGASKQEGGKGPPSMGVGAAKRESWSKRAGGSGTAAPEDAAQAASVSMRDEPLQAGATPKGGKAGSQPPG